MSHDNRPDGPQGQSARSTPETLRSAQSEEIQKILSDEDIWNTELSYVEIDRSYSGYRWEYTANKLRERDKKDVIAAVVIPVAATVLSFVGWDSVLKALGAGLLTLIATLAVIFLLHWLSAPKEIDEALRGDLRAAKNQLAEEKRKIRRIASIAEESEREYLELAAKPAVIPAPEWWLEELKRTHDLIPLQPNLVRPYQGGTINAHITEDGIIVEGLSPNNSAENILAVVAPYQNSPDTRPKRRIIAVTGVIGEITLTNFENKSSLEINQGAWLSEKDNKTNFNVTDKRSLIIGATREEGSAFCAVRREFNSAYPNGHTFLEQLVGDMFAVRIRLIQESDGSLLDNYEMILEITREPELKLGLTNAFLWKSEHLHDFAMEGFDFLTKLHEIWKEANGQLPQPTPRRLFSFAEAVSDARTANYEEIQARIAATEREQEEQILSPIKDWETRAANWVGLIIGADARDKILKSGPSFDVGLNRTRKSALQLMGPPVRNRTKPPSPQIPYWTLADAVRSRVDVLTKLREQLR